jgi:hypothetical protein
LNLFVHGPQSSIGCVDGIFFIVQIIVHQPHIVTYATVVTLICLSNQGKHDIFVELVLFSHDGIVLARLQLVITFIHLKMGFKADEKVWKQPLPPTASSLPSSSPT